MTLQRFLLTTLASQVAKHTTTKLSTVAMSTSSSVLCEELSLSCLDGTVLAAQRYSKAPLVDPNDENTPPTTTKILCIHGWLDNCRSFHALAPAIVEGYFPANGDAVELVALDLPGHGQSSHKSMDAPPMVQADLAYYVHEALHALEWNNDSNDDDEGANGDDTNEKDADAKSENKDNDKHNKHGITLLGHSLGAGVSSTFAAAFPEYVDRIVLLEGAGFMARSAESTPEHARHHMIKRRQALEKVQEHQSLHSSPRGYPSLAVAIKTRQRAALALPQKKRKLLAYKAAEELVLRSTRPLQDDNDNNEEEEDGRVQFCHDSRYHWPSLQYMTWDQVQGCFKAIQHKNICLLIAEQGWPWLEEQMEQTKELLQPTVFDVLPGDHCTFLAFFFAVLFVCIVNLDWLTMLTFYSLQIFTLIQKLRMPWRRPFLNFWRKQTSFQVLLLRLPLLLLLLLVVVVAVMNSKDN